MKKLLLLLLLCSPLQAAVSYVGAGTASQANNASVTPTLHGSTTTGDLILVFAAVHDPPNAGTLACPGTYTSIANWKIDTESIDVVKILVCGKIAGASESSPTIAYTSGESDDRVGASAATFRGVPSTGYINVQTANGVSGAQSVGSGTLGPIPAITPTAANGAIIVLGAKGSYWEPGNLVAVLSGDSLTWAEIGEDQTSNQDGMGLVWDYALWTGAAPTITSKTFAITSDGQADQWWAGGMISLNTTAAASSAPIILSRRRRP